jgi:hypothetical protein
MGMPSSCRDVYLQAVADRHRAIAEALGTLAQGEVGLVIGAYRVPGSTPEDMTVTFRATWLTCALVLYPLAVRAGV